MQRSVCCTHHVVHRTARHHPPATTPPSTTAALPQVLTAEELARGSITKSRWMALRDATSSTQRVRPPDARRVEARAGTGGDRRGQAGRGRGVPGRAGGGGGLGGVWACSGLG